MRFRKVTGVAHCIGCGCHDYQACESRCWWLRVDYEAAVGVCSECKDHVARWDAGDHSSSANLLQPNNQWIEEADAAIRKANPMAAEVVTATRSFAVLGRDGVLTARLADGTEWRIDGQEARQLTADEIAARTRLHESFQ